MRLLTKTTLYFLGAMTLLLLLAGAYLFRQFSRELDRKGDMELLQDEAAWIRYLHAEAANGVTFMLRSPELSIFSVDAPPGRPVITDERTSLTAFPYRQLSQVVVVYGISYQIVIRKSQEQKAALLADITRIILLVFAGLFLATILFNWLISKRMWEPFYQTLNTIRKTNLTEIRGTHFTSTNTREFNELNAALNGMTEKIHSDFLSMKEFTENAAHEMQTPLSVAQSKMELLLQKEDLPEQDAHLILEATNALTRLSKLNQGLLLLAKIENNQYVASEELNLTTVIRKQLELFSELIQDKRLNVTTDFHAYFMVRMHPMLADSLVSNLLGNAIRHNYENGNIEIVVSANNFRISNTTHQPVIPREKIFTRFAGGGGGTADSTGLGLAIVKKITDMHGLSISYRAEAGETIFDLQRR
ncbi:sensor histidine kinase [Flavihumibacter petaseus]|uniref:histidine kinase n=1 Tax=Flavihumibacter petaseus NBRC 106054 TaxID=1220578 RepID=A0A0E9N032_9BACT|nr:ATP-binding protein [Flavihumibacter petaseus]GAO43189.1 putative two-component histidine kinase [Flavihumibacter petaseus NBRC 106054]